MEEDLGVDDIITKFLLNTTRLRPRITHHSVQAAVYCGIMATRHPTDDEEAVLIPLTTGSVAEFYVEPMHKCFVNIDLMYHRNTNLAIPRGHLPPTRLPDEFQNYVKVHEISNSHFMGYVCLELPYSLTQCSDADTYNAVEYDKGICLANQMFSSTDSITGLFTTSLHGPAQHVSREIMISVDSVPCIRCLVWPPGAADWPTRHKNYEWPDSATVEHVSNGCDVVGVAHRQCKHDGWRTKQQWRLSFSRAEIVLINSWMPLQQIVYHLLRVFVTESVDNSGSWKLSNFLFSMSH